jgi:hypothetical protein
MEAVMLRSLAIVVFAVVIILFPSASIPAAKFGTADEAKAMLDRAVAAVKEDETKALDMFNKGQGGFKDRDLYVFCANASDGIVTAHPYGNKGKQLREIFGKKGYPLGQEIMEKATEYHHGHVPVLPRRHLHPLEIEGVLIAGVQVVDVECVC